MRRQRNLATMVLFSSGKALFSLLLLLLVGGVASTYPAANAADSTALSVPGLAVKEDHRRITTALAIDEATTEGNETTATASEENSKYKRRRLLVETKTNKRSHVADLQC